MANEHTHSHEHETPLPKLTLEGLVNVLKGQGMRMTANRHNILRVMLEADVPLGLEEIQQRAEAFGGKPDFATVFRLMLALEKLKLAVKVNLGRSNSHYELLDPQKHHDHLVCVDCGKVTLIEDLCPVEKLERKLAKDYGYSGIKHSLEFFGHCFDCTNPA